MLGKLNPGMGHLADLLRTSLMRLRTAVLRLGPSVSLGTDHPFSIGVSCRSRMAGVGDCVWPVRPKSRPWSRKPPHDGRLRTQKSHYQPVSHLVPSLSILRRHNRLAIVHVGGIRFHAFGLLVFCDIASGLTNLGLLTPPSRRSPSPAFDLNDAAADAQQSLLPLIGAMGALLVPEDADSHSVSRATMSSSTCCTRATNCATWGETMRTSSWSPGSCNGEG